MGGCGLAGSNSQPLGVILFHGKGQRGTGLRAVEDVDRRTHVSIVRFLRVMTGRTFGGRMEQHLPG